jgi:hypothetical protein
MLPSPNQRFSGQKIGSEAGSGFGPKPRAPFGPQDFHFRADRDHSLRHTLIFFSGARNGSRDRTLVDEALQLLVGAQAQHLFAPAGNIPLPEIEENDIEQALNSNEDLEDSTATSSSVMLSGARREKISLDVIDHSRNPGNSEGASAKWLA